MNFTSNIAERQDAKNLECETATTLQNNPERQYAWDDQKITGDIDYGRVGLGKIEGVRRTFEGTFVRYGFKKAFKGPDLRTILLKDVRTPTEQQVFCDHIWLTERKQIQALGEMAPGDVLQFDARVKMYKKGYFGRRWDVYKPVQTSWKLSHPTRFRKKACNATENQCGHREAGN